MDLVVGLRKAHDASPTPICWPDPPVYLAHLRSQERYGHHGHQLPEVRQGSVMAHAPFNRPSDNRVHRRPEVGDSSGARDSSHRRAGDRDRRRPSIGGDGRSRRGPATDNGSEVSRRYGAGHRRNRGQGKESSRDERNRRYRPGGDASYAYYSSSSTNGSGKAPVPEVTTSSKKQVVPSLTVVACSATLLGHLTTAMPVSSNLSHARASTIDSAAAAAAKRAHRRRSTGVQTPGAQRHISHVCPIFSLFGQPSRCRAATHTFGQGLRV